MFSCALEREGHCAQILLTCVGSACSVWTTLGLPPITACVLSQSTLLRLQVALQGCCPKWALGFVHVPGLSCSGLGSRVLHKGTDLVVPFPGLRSSGDQVLGKRSVPGGLCILIISPVPAVWFPGSTARASSQVCHVSPLGS